MGQARGVRVSKGKDHPSAKRHTEKKRKAHHTMKHMQKCPRTPSNEVCPCTHTPLEPPHARQGINKGSDRPPNKPPQRAPRRRPTTHVRILCFLQSRPFARRKEAWYEGHRHVTKKREPHASGERTTARKHTYHKHPGAREEQEVCRRTYMPPQTTKDMDVQNKGHRGWRHMQRQRAIQRRNRHPFSLPEYAHPIGRRRRRKRGHSQKTHQEQEAANTAERKKDGRQRGRKPPTPEKKVDATKEHAKNRKPPTPRNGT